MTAETLRQHARTVWDAGVDAVRPGPLVRAALTESGPLRDALGDCRRITVVGAGKAGAAMAAAVEGCLVDRLDAVDGVVNVPAGSDRPLRRVRLHPARPAGSNHPTAEGVEGADAMLQLLAGAGPTD